MKRSYTVLSKMSALWAIALCLVSASATATCADPSDQTGLDTGKSCFWMENYSGNFQWVPAESGGMYRGGGKEACCRLDSCSGGFGQSGGGCYKWAHHRDSPGEAWRATSSSTEVEIGNRKYRVTLHSQNQGYACPVGSVRVSFDEARIIAPTICRTLATRRQIIRLEYLASMEGAASGCRVHSIDTRYPEFVLCKQDITPLDPGLRQDPWHIKE